MTAFKITGNSTEERQQLVVVIKKKGNKWKEKGKMYYLSCNYWHIFSSRVSSTAVKNITKDTTHVA
jgi:hypothetical protein